MINFFRKPKNVLDRHTKSKLELEKMGLKFNPDLPIIHLDDKIVVKSAKEIASRAYILFILNMVAANEVDAKEAAVFFENYSICFYLTKQEKAFLENPTIEQKTAYTWRVESVCVLLWVLNCINQMEKPTGTCNDGLLHSVFFEENRLITPNIFVAQHINNRSNDEILDMMDLYLRLNWQCIETNLKDMSLPQINQKVVFERLYALQWVTNLKMVWDEMPSDQLSFFGVRDQLTKTSIL